MWREAWKNRNSKIIKIVDQLPKTSNGKIKRKNKYKSDIC